MRPCVKCISLDYAFEPHRLFVFTLIYIKYININIGTYKIEPGSSVSVVSDYGLDDRAIEVRSPADANGFFPVASVSRPALGAHPAFCTMGTGGPFPGGKPRPGRDSDHSPPSSAEVENE
jgi:hypothetical protein